MYIKLKCPLCHSVYEVKREDVTLEGRHARIKQKQPCSICPQKGARWLGVIEVVEETK
jgi:phage FluMu protein Com